MKAYKGFNRDMTCRGFQYEEGKTYETEKADLCNTGFHACENPLDCFYYYAPCNSVFREVELEDVSEQTSDDSKRVAKKITIGAELSVREICKLHFDFVKSKTTYEVSEDGSAAVGDFGSAAAGNFGSAAAGECGNAASRGSVKVGKNGCAVVRGSGVKACVGIGSVLVICEEKADSYDIECCKTITIDGDTYKQNVWYCIKNGKVVEV